MDRLGDADPDVEQADAGDDAAHGPIVQHGGELGMRVHEQVVVPDARPPGHEHDEHTEVHAEQHQYKERQALQPYGRSSSDFFVAGLER